MNKEAKKSEEIALRSSHGAAAERTALTAKGWILIILLDLVAKIGWSIENTWLLLCLCGGCL